MNSLIFLSLFLWRISNMTRSYIFLNQFIEFNLHYVVSMSLNICFSLKYWSVLLRDHGEYARLVWVAMGRESWSLYWQIVNIVLGFFKMLRRLQCLIDGWLTHSAYAVNIYTCIIIYIFRSFLFGNLACAFWWISFSIMLQNFENIGIVRHTEDRLC